MAKTASSPDYSGIKVKVFDLTNGALPAFTTDVSTTYASAIEIGHLEEFSEGGASREVKKYTPLNDTEYKEIVATGSKTNEPFTAKVLYDPDINTEGVHKLRDAFNANENIGLLVELSNKKTKNGTAYAYVCRVSNFSASGERDGKYFVDLTAEKIGDPAEHKAV